MTFISKSLNKITALTLISIFLMSGALPSFVNLKISADVTWNRITDETFADGWDVRDMAVFANNLYFIQSGIGADALYQYDKNTETVTIVNQDLIGNNMVVEINEIETANGVLYVSLYDGDYDKLYTYNGSVWTDISNDIDEEFDNTIDFLGTVNGVLIAQFEMYDGENFYKQLMAFDGTIWSNIADVDSFAGISNESMYIQEVTGSGEGVFLNVFDNISGETGVYFYQGGTDWVRLGGLFDTYYYSNLILFNGTLFITTDDYNTPITVLYYDYDISDWVVVDGTDFGAGANMSELVELNGALYVATTHHAGGNAEIYKSEDGLTWELYVGHISNGEPVAQWDEMSWVTAMTAFDGGLAVGASKPGEGPYYATVWLSSESLPEDMDNIPTEVENAAPNGGDANNDGIADSEQANVTSFVNSVTDSYAVLESTCASTINVSTAQESTNAQQDNTFSYPVGLMSFEIECDPGETALITQYYYGDYNASLMVARKYNSLTNTYTRIEDAEIVSSTIDNMPVLIVTYEITDGGELDEDGEENGIIVDPSGPALSTVGVPNTGAGGLRYSLN